MKKNKKLGNEVEEILTYLEQWKKEEGFFDLSVLIEYQDVEAACFMQVNITFFIDSSECYEGAVSIERDIEKLAASLTEKQYQKRLDKCMKSLEVKVVECPHCNHIQFPSRENYKLYQKELETSCWDCNKSGVKVSNW